VDGQVIREDRDLSFWREVSEHPAVKPHVSLGKAFDIAPMVQSPKVTPLRAENGGFLFVRLDGLGRVYELHTMFKPEGWGREVLLALKAAVAEMFHRGAHLITTYEVEGNWRSQPPKTFRFEPAGEFAHSDEFNASFRTWLLTKSAWEGSPAAKRMT
jgi:hypothetical protein